MKRWQRSAIVVVGFIEALLFSGSLFGWPSLMYVLQKEGVYSNLCSQTTSLKAISGLSNQFAYNDALQDEDVSTTVELVTLPYISTKESSKPVTESLALYNSTLNKTSNAAPGPTNAADILINSENKLSTDNSLHCTQIAASEMTKVYTVAAVAYGITSILIGFSLDYLGLWATRFLGSAMTTGGFFCLTFVSKGTPWLLWPSLNLIALGTNQLRLSCFQFANLWPNHKTTIIIAYSSAYSISTALFLLVQYAYEAAIPFRTIGMVLTGLSLFTFPITFLMPKFKIEDHTDENKQEIISDAAGKQMLKQSDANESENTNKKTEETKECHETRTDKIPLGASLFTFSAGLHLLWHFINFFLVLFYSATFFQWAMKATNSTAKVVRYNQVSGLCAVIAPIFIPIAGFVTDWQIRKASRLTDNVEKLSLTMQAPAYTMAVATSFLISTMICKLFLTEAAIYASIILISISRPFVVGSCTSYLRIRFHADHFNRLNGIFTTVVSLLTLVQSSIVTWMFTSDESFLLAQGILLTILVISLSSPFHMFIKPWARTFSRSHLKYEIGNLH